MSNRHLLSLHFAFQRASLPHQEELSRIPELHDLLERVLASKADGQLLLGRGSEKCRLAYAECQLSSSSQLRARMAVRRMQVCHARGSHDGYKCSGHVQYDVL